MVLAISSASVLMLSDIELNKAMIELSKIDFPGGLPIEYYQSAKDEAIFNQQKYKCSICD